MYRTFHKGLFSILYRLVFIVIQWWPYIRKVLVTFVFIIQKDC